MKNDTEDRNWWEYEQVEENGWNFVKSDRFHEF